MVSVVRSLCVLHCTKHIYIFVIWFDRPYSLRRSTLLSIDWPGCLDLEDVCGDRWRTFCWSWYYIPQYQKGQQVVRMEENIGWHCVIFRDNKFIEVNTDGEWRIRVMSMFLQPAVMTILLGQLLWWKYYNITRNMAVTIYNWQ